MNQTKLFGDGSVAAIARWDRRSTDDERRSPRLKIRLPATCGADERDDVQGHTRDISVDGIAIEARLTMPLETAVGIRMDGLGLYKGRVVRLIPGGFAIDIDHSETSRQRLKERLDLLASDGDVVRGHGRRHDRIVPLRRICIVQHQGCGTMARLENVSASGAAYLSTVVPAVGSPVIVGRRPGRIVRHIEGGAAVEFDRELSAAELTHSLIL